MSLGVAIIGCGAIHNVHVDAIRDTGLGRILWFVDIEDRAKHLHKYGGNWSIDYHKVKIQSPWYICTPMPTCSNGY